MSPLFSGLFTDEEIFVMKGISILALTALIALGLAACGSDKESASTQSATPISEAKASTKGGQGSQATTAKSSTREDEKSIHQGEEKEASDFAPKNHHDSGGGSGQFREPKGGDNSIQDYGAESSESEFEESAAAM